MKKPFLYLSLFVLFAGLALEVTAQDIQDKVRQALTADFRTDADRHADTYRLPAETLAFLGLRDNMRVLELMPGSGGYYAKILGQVLADNGKLYEGLGGDAVADKLSEWGFDKVEILEDNFEMIRGEPRGHNIIADGLNFPVSDIDMVLTFRNLHDFAPDSRMLLHSQVFKVLKSGGIYGVVGHTGRHMEPYNEERWRRLDPVAVIKEIQDSGFRFVDFSDLHYREHDPLKTDTTTPEINRNSDRFTLIFVKP